jgi:hypothetical protein
VNRLAGVRGLLLGMAILALDAAIWLLIYLALRALMG